MPKWVVNIAQVMPSYHLGQLSQMLSGMQPMADIQRHVLVLAAISLAAMIGAWTAWRRQAA
jgi:ABC-2 type transport system permease protein